MRSEQAATAEVERGTVASLLGKAARLAFFFRRTPPLTPQALREAKSLLLIRPEGLGDIILTLPAVAWLRRNHPSAKIAMAVRPAFVQFVRDIGVVDEVVRLDYPKRSTFKPGSLGKFLSQVAALRSRFDIAYDFRGDPRNAMLGAWAARYLVGQAAPAVEFLFSAVAPRSSGSVVAANLAAVSLGHDVPPSDAACEEGYDYQIAPDALRGARAHLGSRENFILVHIGASRPANRWNAAKWRELIQRLLAAGESVVITGAGADERSQVNEVLNGFLQHPELINLVDRTSCSELAALVQLAAGVVSPDTGIAHIAWSRRVPQITIFASDSESKWGHVSTISRPIGVDLPCRPCMAYTCPRTDFPMECTERISVDAVHSALLQVIETADRIGKENSAHEAGANQSMPPKQLAGRSEN